MGFLYGRDRKLSVFRVGLTAAALGILLIGATVVALFLDRTARQAPLEIELPANAEPMGQSVLSSTSRRLVFRVPGATPEEVVAHYEAQLRGFDTDNSVCIRNPSSGNFPGSDTQGRVPYEFVCMFDASSVFSTQYTQVRIQPGIFNADPARNSEGATVVQHDQFWNP